MTNELSKKDAELANIKKKLEKQELEVKRQMGALQKINSNLNIVTNKYKKWSHPSNNPLRMEFSSTQAAIIPYYSVLNE